MNGQTMRVIDALVFPGESLFRAGLPAHRLFAQLDRAGIDGAVLAPPRDPDYSMRNSNTRVAELIEQYPRMRRMLGRVDPNHRDARAEIDYCADELRVAGFYLDPREECFAIDSLRAAPTLEAIASRGLPVVVQAGVPWMSQALQIAAVAERHPELDLVMTNGGQLNISGLGQAEAFEAMERAPRLRILTSGVYRQDFIEGVIERFGAERVMFASAAPIFDPSYEVLRVLEARCSAADRAVIAGAAAESLFWGTHDD